MQAYKFDIRISKDGIISLPYAPALFDKEVELIIVPKEKKKKKQNYSAQDFLNEWSGAFESLNEEDPGQIKHDYLTKKHK